MASYQDFTVQATTGTHTAPSDDKRYYIVGVSNTHTGVAEVQDTNGTKLFEIPPSSTLSIPGQGYATKELKFLPSSGVAFYYIK
jgi:hypothetical protein